MPSASPLGAGLLVRPLCLLFCRPAHSIALPLGSSVLKGLIFQVENEAPCSRALCPAFNPLSLFILVVAREPVPCHLWGMPWAVPPAAQRGQDEHCRNRKHEAGVGCTSPRRRWRGRISQEELRFGEGLHELHQCQEHFNALGTCCRQEIECTLWEVGLETVWLTSPIPLSHCLSFSLCFSLVKNHVSFLPSSFQSGTRPPCHAWGLRLGGGLASAAGVAGTAQSLGSAQDRGVSWGAGLSV